MGFEPTCPFQDHFVSNEDRLATPATHLSPLSHYVRKHSKCPYRATPYSPLRRGGDGYVGYQLINGGSGGIRTHVPR